MHLLLFLEKKSDRSLPKFDRGNNEEKREQNKEKAEETSKKEQTESQSPSKGQKRKMGNKPAITPKKGEKQAANPFNGGKRARLIVRNLSFKVKVKTDHLYIF